MSIGYVASIEKKRKEVKPVVEEVKKTTKKSTKKADKEEEFD